MLSGDGDRDEAERRDQRRARLLAELDRRVLVQDGAMGTELDSLGLSEADVRGARFASHPRSLRRNYDLYCLTRPDAVTAVHEAYLAAGAELLGTNTFNATAIGQEAYGLADLVFELNRAAAALARAAADGWAGRTPNRPRWVAGVMGPTAALLSRLTPPAQAPPPRGVGSVTPALLRAAYAEQARGLIAGGADVLLCETVTDLRNLEAALAGSADAFAAAGVTLPIMISATVDARGPLPSGATLEDLVHAAAPAHPLALGLNCCAGARSVGPHLARLARLTSGRVSCHPSAGLPDPATGSYPEAPEVASEILGELAAAGLVNLVGGCCGTTPAHIAALTRAVTDVRP
jgi:5-methyltetrahydrofolate--homocysteine methyltransferase